MDTSHGRTAGALNRPAPDTLNMAMKALEKSSLFQAIDALCKLLMQANPGITETQAFELIRFTGNESLAFPSGDIACIRPEHSKQYLSANVSLNLLSLTGASSPLPPWWTEAAVGEEADNIMLRQFMDLFNHRLQRLLFKVWQKYRYYVSFQAQARDAFSKQLFSLIGLGSDAMRQKSCINWQRLLPYLGLLSLRVHSAALIESVLRYYFEHSDIYIEQCRLRQVTIPDDQQATLGSENCRLMNGCVIGTQIKDRRSKFRIHIRQLAWSSFHSFFPTGDNYPVLNHLVRFCLKDPLDYDIQLTLRPDEIQPLSLSRDSLCQLAWTSWLNHEQSDGTIILSGSL